MLDVILTLIAAGGAVWLLARFAGFMAQRPDNYGDTLPLMDIRQSLNGPILCEGVIYGPTGRVTSRFVADMEGKWEGNKGVLDEYFRYSSGMNQTRQWRLTLANDGTVLAEADDIIGQGKGAQNGSTLCLKYRIQMPENAGGWTLDVTDWMYLTDNGTIINRSQFRKFGIKVAELVATMRPARS